MAASNTRPMTIREAGEAAAKEGLPLSKYLPVLEAQFGPEFQLPAESPSS